LAYTKGLRQNAFAARWGAYSAAPDLLTGFARGTDKVRGLGREREQNGKERKGRETGKERRGQGK